MIAALAVQMLRLIGGNRKTLAARGPNDEMRVLLEGALEGNARAERTFLASVAPHVLRVVRRVMGSHHPDVEDVAQEALFQVLAAIPNFEQRATVTHFVCRVALLTAINVRRRERAAKRGPENAFRTSDESLAAHEPTPEADVDTRRQVELVREALRTLPEPQAEALGLQCVLGYSIKEIAAVTDVPEETVRSRLRAARRALRERLMGNEGARARLEVAR